jgi:hypothetical protein
VLGSAPYRLTWDFAVELRGLEPLTPCMPSQSHRHTGPYRTSLDTTSPQVGWAIKDLAVLSCVGPHGPVADVMLTTAQRHNAGSGAEPQRCELSRRSARQASPIGMTTSKAREMDDVKSKINKRTPA